MKMREKAFMRKTMLSASTRLLADAKDTFFHYVEGILDKYGIKRSNIDMYPREYAKHAGDDASTLIKTIKTDFEKLGFRFKKIPIHSPDTPAISAVGIYRVLDYIIDIVFRHNELKVAVYF